MIDVLLKGIEVKLGVDFFDDRNYWESIAEKIVYCGEIDKFFDYRLGRLEYRSLRFETETLPMSNRQGVAVMNYTDAETPYTRIIEHKHFECFGNDVYRNPVTVITREYSAEWKPGLEPYYPVNDERNSKLYESYAVLAKDIPNILFAGRLAEYRYYDMAPIVAKALKEEF